VSDEAPAAYAMGRSVDASSSLQRGIPRPRTGPRCVNDAVVRLGIVKGEFHRHTHEDEDEFFLVLDGRLLLDVEDQGTMVLGRHQAYTVPQGVAHRFRAPDRTVILMIEPRGVVPTGD
jgi:mannose-6-phosphate isomerase-like protein (cupin superfamily)